MNASGFISIVFVTVGLVVQLVVPQPLCRTTITIIIITSMYRHQRSWHGDVILAVRLASAVTLEEGRMRKALFSCLMTMLNCQKQILWDLEVSSTTFDTIFVIYKNFACQRSCLLLECTLVKGMRKRELKWEIKDDPLVTNLAPQSHPKNRYMYRYVIIWQQNMSQTRACPHCPA